jgi:hypothetical protein
LSKESPEVLVAVSALDTHRQPRDDSFFVRITWVYTAIEDALSGNMVIAMEYLGDDECRAGPSAPYKHDRHERRH